MENDIKKIILELEKIDSEFANSKDKLRPILENIISQKPAVKIDRRFESQLRAQLQLKSQGQTKQNFAQNIINLFTMKKLGYTVAALALVIMILVPAVTLINEKQKTDQLFPIFTQGLKITKVAKNGFGALSSGNNAASPSAGGESATQITQGLGSSVARGMGGGGGGSPAMDSKMIVGPEYQSVQNKYVYTGEPLTLEETQLEVLQRIKESSAPGGLANLMKNFNLGLADLTPFSESKVQNISFVQSTPYGYIIYADLVEGNLTIYKNWTTWPQNTCQYQACFDRQKIKYEDLPADNTLIKLADEFLTKYKISTANYGEPFVDNDWKKYYAAAENKADYWIPDAQTVIYPLLINGKKVYEGSGYTVGLQVQVDIKEKKVAGVYGLTTQNYQSSEYAAETDTARINKWIEKGGIFNWSYGTGEKIQEIKLQNPELGYFRKWVYESNSNKELLVPALIFPIADGSITSDSQTAIMPYYNYRKNIIIPLIKEVLDEFEAGDPTEPIRIMPLTEPAADDTATTDETLPVSDPDTPVGDGNSGIEAQ